MAKKSLINLLKDPAPIIARTPSRKKRERDM